MKRRNKWQAQGWTQAVRSRDVGRTLRLVPYWESGSVPTDRGEIIIDPGPSFGAGDHPTTVLALELLEEALNRTRGEKPMPSLLDVGTGTGVLAVAGRLLGTGFTVGLDIDPAAIFTARRNLRLNAMAGREDGEGRGVELFVGGVDAVKGSYDLVAANLAAPVLLRLRDEIVPRVGRSLILSGIAAPMAESVIAEYSRGSLTIVKRVEAEEWHAVLLEKGEL
jgi:ribosomal protein L11 methyltransferase